MRTAIVVAITMMGAARTRAEPPLPSQLEVAGGLAGAVLDAGGPPRYALGASVTAAIVAPMSERAAVVLAGGLDFSRDSTCNIGLCGFTTTTALASLGAGVRKHFGATWVQLTAGAAIAYRLNDLYLGPMAELVVGDEVHSFVDGDGAVSVELGVAWGHIGSLPSSSQYDNLCFTSARLRFAWR